MAGAGCGQAGVLVEPGPRPHDQHDTGVTLRQIAQGRHHRADRSLASSTRASPCSVQQPVKSLVAAAARSPAAAVASSIDFGAQALQLIEPAQTAATLGRAMVSRLPGCGSRR